MSTKKTVKVKKPAKAWTVGDVVPAGTIAYKAVRGSDSSNAWYILKCITTADGIALGWNSKFPVKFKVPSVVVTRAWKVVGGRCNKCNHTARKRTNYTEKRNFVADHSRYSAVKFRYAIDKLATVKDYTSDRFCGKGIHLFPTRAAALDYAE